MMIVMKESATADQVEAVVRQVEHVGAKAHVSKGELHTVIGAIGDRDHVANLELDGFPGVDHVVPITRPYKLASLQFKREEYSVFDIGGRKIGGNNFMMIAGPCTIESRDQMLTAAHADEKAGYSMELMEQIEALPADERHELLSAKDSPVWEHENPLD